MAFDGIVTKAITSELQELLGARIDKVYQPDKNTVVLGLYLDGKNYALNICIDSKYGRLHLTTHSKPNPQMAPNFCMLLRKHLIGLRLKNIITSNLERLVTLEFDGFDEFDDVVLKKLVVELMGKHGNILLLDENRIIIDSLRHPKVNDSQMEETRNIIPHKRYLPPTTTKFNFFDTLNFDIFKSKLSSEYIKNVDNTNNINNYNEALDNQHILINVDNVADIISAEFNGISKSFINYILDFLNIKEINDNTLEQIYNYITTILENINKNNLSFKNVYDKDENVKDYFLIPNKTDDNLFNLNFYIDDFYFNKETEEDFKNYRNTNLKLILSILKKYNTRLQNINNKLKECENMDTYKLYGELITANLYKIKDFNLSSIELENYYDNNKKITIPLDKKYSPNENAKRYFKKYNKLKNTLEIVGVQKKETLNELNYIESIVYELENATSIDEVTQIFEEMSENVLFKETVKNRKKSSKLKKSKLTKNKTVSFNPIKYSIDGFTILVGRNNKENDYLTLKYAQKTDLWFHTKDIHGSHVILKNPSQNINDDILNKCAQIAVKHSKAKNSSNVPVDYCLVKFVKKPNNAKPGMVIYTDYKTIYATCN